VREAEASIKDFPRPKELQLTTLPVTTAELICHASQELPLRVIAVFTETGSTARLISKYRPRQPIIAFSPNQDIRRQISLLWGVLPRRTRPLKSIEDMVTLSEERLLEEHLVRKGDLVGIVAGTPLGVGGSTNFIRFYVVGGGSQWRT
jgi:pyruvate kinase